MTAPSIYQEVTARIVAALEAHPGPWVAPWTTPHPEGGSLRPHNGYTGANYRGINTLLLWAVGLAEGYASNEWFTLRQANRLNAHVTPGQKGTPIVYYGQYTDDQTHPLDELGTEGHTHANYRFAKRAYVFNRQQITGLPVVTSTSDEATVPIDTEADAIPVIESTIVQTGATIHYQDGGTPHYLPALDSIYMPLRRCFQSVSDFYATLFHELAHWTGHASRLARPIQHAIGSKEYAREELVAELTAAFLGADFSLVGELQHAEYLNDWLALMRADARLIFQVASAAEKAAEFIRLGAPSITQ